MNSGEGRRGEERRGEGRGGEGSQRHEAGSIIMGAERRRRRGS